MSALVIVAAIAAGAVGCVLRWGITRLGAAQRWNVPIAVFVANILGCLVAGIGIGLATGLDDPALRYVVLSGLAGGTTTFSTFSVETIQLWLDGRRRAAVANVAGSLFFGGIALSVGVLLAVLGLAL